MTLRTDSQSRERILLIGGFGAGKSHATHTVWKWLNRNGQTGGRVYILDTDDSVDRAVDEYGPLFKETVTSRGAWEWADLQVVDEWARVASRDDFLIVDRIEVPWTLVQDYYTEQVWGKSAAGFFLDYKVSSKGKSGSPLADAHGTNWDVINKVYREWMMKVLRWPGHVIATSDTKPVERPDRTGAGGDDPTTIHLFGKYGIKPAGQKDLGKQFHTILWMQPQRDRWAFTTVRDRNREEVTGGVMGDFVLNYLVRVAGWKL